MKHIIGLTLVLIQAVTLSAQVSFRISDGMYNEVLKKKVEQNISCLLTEINRASSYNAELQLNSIDCTNECKDRLLRLWSCNKFKCVDNEYVEPVLKLMSQYEVRIIGMSCLNHKEDGDSIEEFSITFDKDGKISAVHVCLPYACTGCFYHGSGGMKDIRNRRYLLSVVENLKTCYVAKDYYGINLYFKKSSIKNDSIRIAEKLQNLKQQFLMEECVSVSFSDIEIEQHSAKEVVYMLTFKETIKQGNNHVEDFVQLLFDLSNENSPTIHFVGVSPVSTVKSKDELKTPSDFFVL